MHSASRLITASGIVCLFIAVGIFFHDGRAIALSFPFLAYLALLLLSPAPAIPKITVSRHLSRHRIIAGEAISVTLTVKNLGSPIPWLGISDSIPPGLSVENDEATSWLGPLSTSGTAKIAYTVHAPRGKYTFTDVRLRAWSRFGLIPVDWEVPALAQLLVLPHVERLNEIEIRPRRTRVYFGSVKANAGGTGTDFFGCRVYTQGDDIRRINWRAYARTGKLIITEHEQERIADVNVVLDARLVAHPEPILFEDEVRAAASLADLFLAQGDRVGLLIYGDILNWTYPGFGKRQRERILDALATAKLGDKAVFADLRFIPTRLFPSRSQLVVVSPLAGEDDVGVFGLLRARGYQIILISPDPIPRWRAQASIPSSASVALATRILRLKRHIILSTLARIGVEVVDWDTRQGLARATDWALSRRGRRFR